MDYNHRQMDSEKNMYEDEILQVEAEGDMIPLSLQYGKHVATASSLLPIHVQNVFIYIKKTPCLPAPLIVRKN